MRVTPPDLELWLTRYVRAVAATEGKTVDVTNKEPADLGQRLPLDRPLIVIRDDSGTRLEWTTFDRSIGASVLGGSKRADQPINDIARWLAAVLFDDAIVLAENSPIASVEWDGCNGPYAVAEELDVARRYMTAQYVVTGSW
ncbi:hypothetical protein QWJ90_01320 [Microbacterium oryzae]|uniref:hypothetical protein n=1 Tax=Microbacterium oryzae TaxID=743009 RepID=UPI0025B0B92B|nr:hypothetical protein [Microbacterium oryzae]MDN3309562.1 hypothetical protein [Microbacterium oryzae]